MYENERRDYETHIPEQLTDFAEVKALSTEVNVQIKDVYGAMEVLLKNVITNTMDEKVVARWEKILSITSPSEATLEARRNAILAKFKSRPPINLETLKNIVEAYLGVPVDVKSNEQDYVVTIKYRGLKSLPDLTPLYNTVYQIIPANILMEIVYAFVVWDEVIAKTWDSVSSKTWNQIMMGEE